MPSSCETLNEDNFLEQLDCLHTARSSARSQNARHTWRSGLIPPFLEPSHRIPSHFPVPRGTLAQVPGLNHPDLSRGQRRYLHSTAQIYSMDGSKRALSDSYYGLLMSELLRGGGTRDSHSRYTVWIYGNHKRLYETDPKIWRSPRRRNHSREVTADEKAAESGGRTASMDSDSRRHGRRSNRRHDVGRVSDDDSGAKSKAAVSKSPTKSAGERNQREPEERANSQPPPPSLPPPLQSRRSQLGSAGARSLRTRATDGNDEVVVVTAAASDVSKPASQPPRLRSAPRSAQQRSGAADVRSSKGGNEEKADGREDNADQRRPRDLSKIMY